MIAYQCTFFFFASVATVTAGSTPESIPDTGSEPRQKSLCVGDEFYHTFEEVANYNATTGTLSAPGFVEPLTLPADVDWSTFEITSRNETAVATVSQFDLSTYRWKSKSFVSGTKRVFDVKGTQVLPGDVIGSVDWEVIEKYLTGGQPGMVVSVENLSTLTVSNGQMNFTARPLLWDPAHQKQFVMFTGPQFGDVVTVQVELSFNNNNINDFKIGAVNYDEETQIYVAQNYFPNPLFPGMPAMHAWAWDLAPYPHVTRDECQVVLGFGQGRPIERCVEVCSGIHPM